MEKLEGLIIDHFTAIIFTFALMWIGLIVVDLIMLKA